TGAITFVEREAAAYDEAAVQAAKGCSGGCPGSAQKTLSPAAPTPTQEAMPSQLRQWPAQIKLVPPNAPWLKGADLLIAADCTAYAYAGFHGDFMKGRITLIGCPKLDAVDYAVKLTQILMENDIQTITVARMEVPCCGGIEFAVKKALADSGKDIPLSIVTVSIDGKLLRHA
ncbi:MAG: ferredoxin, partial [Oscillibacter sp.]|nr:ferredoxin [Oscillibacter sp.]